MNATVGMRWLASHLLPSQVRRSLGEHIGGRERLADITPVDHLRDSLEQPRAPRVWIDVGAYRGDMTFAWARRCPNLTVYAFEPNLKLAALLSGRLSNYVVIPAAVAEHDGVAPFFVTRFPASSSLLPLNPAGARRWVGGEKLEVIEKTAVATIRLETFLNVMKIATVDFLKVDAQGADLAVIASAGSRLRDISRVVFEVGVTPDQVYVGAPSKARALEFMRRNGFELRDTRAQSSGQEENLTFTRAVHAPPRGLERVEGISPLTAAR